MARKQPDEPEEPAKDQALVKRVDDMMGSEPADGATKITVNIGKPASTAKPAAASQISAPELPAALLKQIKTEDDPPPEKVLKIDSPQPPSEPEPAAANETLEPAVDLEDNDTAKAVDDIVANEGDTMLALEDAKNDRKQQAVAMRGSGWKAKLRALAKNKWTWVGLVVLLLIIFGVPTSRYKLLGLVLKKSVTISVIDSKTATPVSSAQVQLGGDTAKTDADGQVKIRAGLGKHSLTISKHYYRTATTTYFVGFKAGAPAKVKLTATGRLVPVTVLNTITGQPLAGAVIQVHGTTAKTNAKGQANVALPTSSAKDSAKLSLNGYNPASVSIEVTDRVVKANSFTLTPVGQVYFLSNATGKLDVVKANLDGTDRKTVLEGTGKEDTNNTSLLASRDWRFLVLKARRDTAQPVLYLIDTSTDKVTEFDTSNSNQTLIGWYGHNFMYDLNSSAPSPQAGRETIKSYDADHLQLNQLDQNQAEGTSASFAYQSFANFYILNNELVYSVQWFTSYSPGGSYDLTGKNATIRAVQPSGQNKKDYQSFPAGTTGTIQAALYQPQAVYFAVYDNGSNATTYYEYTGQVVKSASIDQSTFNQAYPTYLLSPSGNQTFWTELRDGKNTLFTGDSNAGSKKPIASLSDYSPYGWFSDAYVLVSKSSSELYVIPASGLSAGHQPLKITNYYKPAQNFNGYGYGYGGL